MLRKHIEDMHNESRTHFCGSYTTALTPLI